jgi:hypothetical protein
MNALVQSKAASSASKRVTYSISTPAAGPSTFRVTIGSTPASAPKPSKEIERAVYGYVRAVRALGRTELVVSDISRALNIAEPAVVQALTALRSKGVKFA